VDKGTEAASRAVQAMQAMQSESLTSVDEKIAMVKAAAGDSPEASAKLRALLEVADQIPKAIDEFKERMNGKT
jgi:hypothetical protein